MKLLRQILRRTRFYPVYKRLGHYPDFVYWKLRGRPPRPPHLVKQRLVRQYASEHGLPVLVEAGTYFGEMIYATRRDFEEIFSIEFDSSLAARAAARFAHSPHIHVLHGSSELMIPQVLATLTRPALFWLDAGYCAWNGNFADSSRLLTELAAILSHHLRAHIVLVDDVAVFSGIDGTPDVAELTRHILTRFPGRTVKVHAGILVII